MKNFEFMSLSTGRSPSTGRETLFEAALTLRAKMGSVSVGGAHLLVHRAGQSVKMLGFQNNSLFLDLKF